MDDVLTRHTRCLRLSLPVFLSSVSVLSASLAATSRQQMAVASASLRSAVFAYAAPSSSSSSSSARSLLFPSGGNRRFIRVYRPNGTVRFPNLLYRLSPVVR
ncbi:hypothetical protein MLD38_020239 [Melastoma candidum]|uniref:Uncharacterized protein n=1 Tax=Melastoma candidum TaxID=119954 RepID=A0ACB9QKB4_9MYRT|nr:hypothetical protein MLD38_020239 [Melastoma candidum]